MSVFWADCFAQVELYELLKDNAIMELQDSSGNTFLHALLCLYPDEGIKYIISRENLLRKNGALNTQNRMLNTPIMLYLQRQSRKINEEFLLFLLEKELVDLFICNASNEYLAMFFAKYAGKEVNNYLIQNVFTKVGAKFSSIKDQYENNILHYAFENQNAEVFEAYYNSQIFMHLKNLRNKYGFTIDEKVLIFKNEKPEHFALVEDKLSINVNEIHPVYKIPFIKLIEQMEVEQAKF